MTTLRWLLLHVIQILRQFGSILYRRSRLSTRKPSLDCRPGERVQTPAFQDKTIPGFRFTLCLVGDPSFRPFAGGRNGSAVRDRIDPGFGFRRSIWTTQIARSDPTISESLLSISRRRRRG